MAGLANINIKFTTDLKSFSSGMQNAERSIQKASANMRRVGSQLTAGITAPLTILAYKGVESWDKQAKAIAQVDAGLKSTGNQVGYTSQQLQKMASELQNNTLFGDEEILQGVTAQLLTFTNIADDEFARTQKAALDLATRLDGDLKSASIQLGKALNDPVANLSALSRSGIQFSKEQKTLINSLWETGQRAEAQRLILAELEKQYGGSAAAAAKAGTGAFKQLQNSFGDLLEEFGKIITEFLTPLVEYLKKGVTWFQSLSESTKKWIVVIGGIAAAIGPLLMLTGTILPALMTGFTVLTGPIGLVAAGLTAIAVGVIKNWPEVKKMILSVVDAFVKTYNESESLRFAIGLLGATFKWVWEVIKFAGSAIWEVLKLIAKNFATTFSTIFKTIDKLTSGDFSGAMSTIKEGFAGVQRNFMEGVVGIGLAVEKAFKNSKNIALSIPANAKIKLDPKQVSQTVTDTIGSVENAFNGLAGGSETEIKVPAKAIANVDTNSLKQASEIAKAAAGSFNDLNERISALTQLMNNTSDPKLISSYKEQIAALQLQLDMLDTQINSFEGTPVFSFLFPGPALDQSQISASIQRTVDEMASQGEELKENLNNYESILADFNRAATAIMDDLVVNVATGFGEIVGNMLAGATKSNSIANMLLETFANMAVQLGKLAISTGVAILGIKIALKSINPFAAIAAGIALVALGTLVKAKMSKLANPPALASGGVVYGDTLARVGEYRNASINPEVIAPLNTLKKFLQPSGLVGGTVVFKQQGSELIGVLEYQNKVNSKIS